MNQQETGGFIFNHQPPSLPEAVYCAVRGHKVTVDTAQKEVHHRMAMQPRNTPVCSNCRNCEY